MKKLIIIIAAITILPSALFGFGKNKVQYQYMDWRYLHAPHYTLYFHQDQGTLPDMSYVWMNGIYADLSARFGLVHKKPVPVILYGSPALFEQTNIISEMLPEEVGGFTEIFKNRVAVPFDGSYKGLRHVLHHEMVHAFVFGVMLERGGLFGAVGANVPLWFNEGLAEMLSTGWDREADMYMLDRVLNSTVPPPGPMMNGYIVYKGGQSFFYYLYSTGGENLFNRMLSEFRKTRDAEKAIETVYGSTIEDLGKEWLRELRRIYWPEIGRRMEPSSHASAITESAKDRSNFNMRPRVSHGGTRIAFFSDKRNYTNIIITDTAGKEMRRIGQHGFGAGESFESFQAMSGAIAWGPSGMELAFAARRGGASEIRIVDIQKRGGETKRSIDLQLPSINGLDWSRDGSMLAITAISGGRTDLFTYNLTNGKFVRHTNTAQSKSSPRFSPDGKKIMFTITDTAGLGADPLRSKTPRPTSNIATYDIETQTIALLTDNKWNDKDAAWSPDGQSFVFVSDRNGIDNLYIAPIDAPENPRPLTDYAGSAGNPDWAADGSAIVFDNFANQSRNVWRMEKPLEKMLKDTALVKTVWAEHEENPSAPFFRRKSNLQWQNSVDTPLANDDGAQTADTIPIVEFDDEFEIYGFSRFENENVPEGENGVVIDIRDLSDHEHDEVPKYGRAAKARADSAARAQSGAADSVRVADSMIAAENARLHKDFVPIDGIPAPEDYRLRFTPDLVLFGLGISTYSGAAGQAMAQFSDIMGDHRITLVGDLQMDFTEYAQIFAGYEYLKLRTDIMGGAFYYKYYSYDGRFRQYYHDLETGGMVGARYPFSKFSRADLYLRSSYIKRVPLTGENVKTREENATLGILGYTYDNILWGITGPLKGFRGNARLYLSPPLGFIEEQYASAEIDVRHYTHFFKRYVWANRLTLGGSLSLNDGDTPARRFVLGGNENWFNYDVNIDNYNDNIAYSNYAAIITPLRGWNYFETTGDRMFLYNTEFRFPFIRELSTVWPVPMQLRYVNGALFIDAGYAWDRGEQGGTLPIPPRLLGGYGFGMRANLGIFVLRYDRGWPMGHGRKGPINYFSLGGEF